jgi:hypothetical protein
VSEIETWWADENEGFPAEGWHLFHGFVQKQFGFVEVQVSTNIVAVFAFLFLALKE